MNRCERDPESERGRERERGKDRGIGKGRKGREDSGPRETADTAVLLYDIIRCSPEP